MPAKNSLESKEARRRIMNEAIDNTVWPDEQLKFIITKAVREYKGNLETLSSAIGCMFLCMYFGRRVMQVVYTLQTIRTYERVLQVRFKELSFIPDITPNSERSVGYNWARSLDKFWDGVRGAKPFQSDFVTEPGGDVDSSHGLV